MKTPTVTATQPPPGIDLPLEESILWVERLGKVFSPTRSWWPGGASRAVHAVADVSFSVRRGETFGFVGESGCGKSTLARCILRLIGPTSGRVIFDGVDLSSLARRELQPLRRRMQIVFQDPYASLDPRMTARAIVAEPLVVHGIGSRAERGERSLELLELVGLSREQGNRKPHAFSGGQRQRIAIARALVLNPQLVVLDEPVSALDVSIQAQVLNLLRELQQRLGLTYLFIGHDLAIAEYFCDRLAVLYRGEIMELADRTALFRTPLHPYTVSLLSAVPVPEVRRRNGRRRSMIAGEVSTSGAELRGCSFRDRCPVGRDRALCAEVKPPLVRHGDGHWAACHFPGETSAVRATAEIRTEDA